MPNKLPKDYFKQLHGRIMQNVHAMPDYLEEDAPLLNGLKARSPYMVPKDYFNELENILSNNRPKLKTRSLTFYRIAVAASFALLIYFSFDDLALSSGNTDDLALNEIVSYYMENSYLIEQDMMDILEEEFDDNPVSYFDGIGDDALELYLSSVIDELGDEELALIEELY